MMQGFDKWLESLLLLHKVPIVVKPDLSPIVRVNTKGSYSTAIETRDDIDFGCQCELYTLVDYVCSFWLVAHWKCFESFTMLHGQPSPLTFVTSYGGDGILRWCCSSCTYRHRRLVLYQKHCKPSLPSPNISLGWHQALWFISPLVLLHM